MKHLFFMASAAIISLSSCTQQPQAPEYTAPSVFKNDNVDIRQIDEHTWHAFGNLMYNESMYLIEGDSAAILLDAGTKIPGLRKIVEGIVHKPVTLIATHVHPDHTGMAVNEWDSIWIAEADEVNVPRCMPGYKGVKQYLTNGQTFNLGGRVIEAVFTPGHTPGSVTFVDKEAHYGFSGDAFGSTNLLVFTDISTVKASCDSMSAYIQKYDIKYFYPGHFGGSNLETPQRVNDLSKICAGILDGSIKPTSHALSNLSNIVDMYGVKVNYNDDMIK